MKILVLTIDCATEKSTLYGDDLTGQDIVWEGQRTSNGRTIWS